MRALLSSEKFVNNKMSLPIALGKKIDNENYIVDLATMPHLLMAGATGQGKFSRDQCHTGIAACIKNTPRS